MKRISVYMIFLILCLAHRPAKSSTLFDYHILRKQYQSPRLTQIQFSILQHLTYSNLQKLNGKDWESSNARKSLEKLKLKLKENELTTKALGLIILLAHEYDLLCKRVRPLESEVILTNDAILINNWNFYLDDLASNMDNEPDRISNSILSTLLRQDSLFWKSAIKELREYGKIPTNTIDSVVDSNETTFAPFRISRRL